MERFKWYLKQLLPLKYKTTYTAHMSTLNDDGDAGGAYSERHRATWRMWMGRCFAIDDTLSTEPNAR